MSFFKKVLGPIFWTVLIFLWTPQSLAAVMLKATVKANVYDENKINQKIVGTLEQGKKYKLLKTKPGLYLIQGQGLKGWVSQEALKKIINKKVKSSSQKNGSNIEVAVLWTQSTGLGLSAGYFVRLTPGFEIGAIAGSYILNDYIPVKLELFGRYWFRQIISPEFYLGLGKLLSASSSDINFDYGMGILLALPVDSDRVFFGVRYSLDYLIDGGFDANQLEFKLGLNF